MECDVIDNDSSSLDDSVMSESSVGDVGERLEVLLDKVIQLMEKMLITENADEREGLHTEMMADMSVFADLMDTPDSKRQLNVASYVLSPNCRLQVIYAFLEKSFASE